MNDYNLSDLIVKKVCAVNRINVIPFQKVYRKNRERDAIAIKTSGKTVYSSNGKSYVSDYNHIIILPKGASYSWICSEPGECLMIEFESELTVGCGLKSFKVPNQAEFAHIFNRIEPSWIFKKPAYTLLCIAGLYEILAKLANTELPDYSLTTKYDIIKPSLKYLEEHYNDPDLSNDKLSKISGISTIYFRKIFTGIYNISPMKYIQTIRIEKAKDILLSDYYSIANVAEAVGFTNIYHFSKVFKRVTGLTPSAFARQYFNSVN